MTLILIQVLTLIPETDLDNDIDFDTGIDINI